MEQRVHRVEFEDWGSEALLASRMAPGLYLLHHQPIFTELANYGDLIRAEETGADCIRYVETEMRNSLSRLGDGMILTMQQRNNPGLQAVLDRIMETGGYWQIDFGGLLTVWFDDGRYNPAQDLTELHTGYDGPFPLGPAPPLINSTTWTSDSVVDLSRLNDDGDEND